jgi:hypothetical protein
MPAIAPWNLDPTRPEIIVNQSARLKLVRGVLALLPEL